MVQVNLKRLISQKQVLSVLHELSDILATPIAIQDVNGVMLMGQDSQAECYAIELAGEVIGWVSGAPMVVVIAHLLSHLAEKEVEKKTLANEVLDKYREINLLYKLSEKIATCLDPTEVAELAIEEAMRLIKGTSASVMLLHPDTRRLEIVAGYGSAAPLKGKVSLEPGRGIAGSVLISGKAEIVNDVNADPRFAPGVNRVTSLMCAPLKTSQESIGVINVSGEEPTVYSAQDLKLLTTVASQAAAAIENALLHQSRLREERIKSQLERYIPAQLVQAIIESKGDISLAPARKPITVLFSDIRNFTTKCEELEAEVIVGYLNEYFTHMVDVIFTHEGTVNKFVGDMIVAMFGAPSTLENNEERAIAAAIAMQHRIQNIPILWIRENFITGIGITSGKVVVGNIGSLQHMDYTAIGDEVNLASRLQSIAQGGQILVSRSVYEATQHVYNYRAFGTLNVKGKKNEVEVFEVVY